jgi:hypothetical protein
MEAHDSAPLRTSPAAPQMTAHESAPRIGGGVLWLPLADGVDVRGVNNQARRTAQGHQLIRACSCRGDQNVQTAHELCGACMHSHASRTLAPGSGAGSSWCAVSFLLSGPARGTTTAMRLPRPPPRPLVRGRAATARAEGGRRSSGMPGGEARARLRQLERTLRAQSKGLSRWLRQRPRLWHAPAALPSSQRKQRPAQQRQPRTLHRNTPLRPLGFASLLPAWPDLRACHRRNAADAAIIRLRLRIILLVARLQRSPAKRA